MRNFYGIYYRLHKKEILKQEDLRLISADELIVAHTNETEYRSFISNKKNEALHSRIIVMPVPYNLKVSEEEHIYEKMIRESDVSNVHIAPHTLKRCGNVHYFNSIKGSEEGRILI